MEIRILVVGKSTGGVGQYLRWLARGLDKDRFRPTFACLSEGGPELASELSRVPGTRAFSLSMNRYRINPLTDGWVAFRLARAIRRDRYDLIHAHASKAGFLTRAAAAGTRTPVIYSPHSFAFQGRGGRARAATYAALERFAARHLTARIVTVSDHEREAARRYRVGRRDQFVTVHSGVDLRVIDAPVDHGLQRKALGVPPGVPLVGTVGRLHPPKTPLDWVRAAARVGAERPDVHFLWAGRGPLGAPVRTEVEALGLSDRVHLVGHRDDVPGILQVLDCFVLPSRWEGFPLAILEAMGARLPVVATRTPGTAELVRHGESGLLVPVGDPVGLAQAILEFVNDRAKARRFGANGRRRVEEEFTFARMLRGIMRVYEETWAIGQGANP